jgi:putative membrane protein
MTDTAQHGHDSGHPSGTGVIDKATEMIGGLAGTAKAALGSGSTETFVTNAVRGDLYEIAAAELALQRAGSDEIRSLARTMLDDHRTSRHQLQSALRSNETPDLALPTELDQHRATMLDHLGKAGDAEFDALYLDQQHMAHGETLTLFEGYAARGDNAQLASYAKGTIPTLMDHHRMCSSLRHA